MDAEAHSPSPPPPPPPLAPLGNGGAGTSMPTKTGLLKTLNQLSDTLQNNPRVTEDVADNVTALISNAVHLTSDQNGDFSGQSAMPIEMAANAALRSLKKSSGDADATYLSLDTIEELRKNVGDTIKTLESGQPPKQQSRQTPSNSTAHKPTTRNTATPNTSTPGRPSHVPNAGTGAPAASSQAIANDFASSGAFVIGDEATAIGANAVAFGQQSTAVGAGAIAAAHDSIALGSGSVAERDGTVSVGRDGHERQITHVASGTEPADAVNVTQLRAAMSSANAYTNQRIGDLQKSIADTARGAYSGVAAATALTMIPDVDRGNTLSIGIGGAVYKGHQAVALGGTARISENLKVRAGVAMSAGGNAVGVGMSWQW